MDAAEAQASCSAGDLAPWPAGRQLTPWLTVIPSIACLAAQAELDGLTLVTVDPALASLPLPQVVVTVRQPLVQLRCQQPLR